MHFEQFQNSNPSMDPFLEMSSFILVFKLTYWQILEKSSRKTHFQTFSFLGHEPDRITGEFVHVWMRFPEIGI